MDRHSIEMLRDEFDRESRQNERWADNVREMRTFEYEIQADTDEALLLEEAATKLDGIAKRFSEASAILRRMLG